MKIDFENIIKIKSNEKLKKLNIKKPLFYLLPAIKNYDLIKFKKHGNIRTT